MGTRWTAAIGAALVLMGCGDDAPRPAPVVPEEAAAEAPDLALPQAPAPAAEAPDDPRDEAPAEPPAPDDFELARRDCARGWERFGEDELVDAGNLTSEGLDRLRLLPATEPRVRRLIGQCLYNRGRIAEARGSRSSAAAYYASSLLYRANEVVRARWQTVAREGATPPVTAPASAHEYAQRVLDDVCEGRRRERFDADEARWSGVAMTCDASLGSVAVVDPYVVVVVDYYAAQGDRPYDESWGYVQPGASLAVLDGGRWRELAPNLFSMSGGDLGRTEEYDADVSVRDLVRGGAPEIVAHVRVSWSYIPSADDGGGEFEGPLVCGRGDDGWRCAQLCERASDSEDESGCRRQAELRDDGTVAFSEPYDPADPPEEPSEPTVVSLADVLADARPAGR